VQTDYASDVVAQYASESPLRAFDREHRLFLMHDDATGRTHEVAVSPQGTVEIKDSSLSNTDKENLARTIHAAMPRITSESFTIGQPPAIFSALHFLGREQDSVRGNDKVTFVLKERGLPRYHAVVFQFEQSRLISEGLYGVSEADLFRWQQADSWPQDWKN